MRHGRQSRGRSAGRQGVRHTPYRTRQAERRRGNRDRRIEGRRRRDAGEPGRIGQAGQKETVNRRSWRPAVWDVREQSRFSMKKAIYRTLGLAILVAGCWYGYRYYRQMPARQDVIPTAKVQRGDVVIRAFSRGELRAVRTVTLTAPNLFGTVQVTDLAPMGSLAKEKDLIVEYDDSERQSALEEDRLGVQSVDEQIKKAKADLAITQSQDAVTLLKTRYNVRRAELDVQRNPTIAEIDGKKNILTLEQQKRALLELESDIKSDRKSTRLNSSHLGI